MDKAEREEIRARCEAATRGPWMADKCGRSSDHDECYVLMGDETIECFSYQNAEFAAHARQDIPALLDALDDADKRYSETLQLVYSSGMAAANAQCDMWRARAEALERAVKAVAISPCDACVNGRNGDQTQCRDTCGPELKKWLFDEAKFAPEAKDE